MIEKNIGSVVETIKQPVITDKTNLLLEENKYSFLVDKKATKPLIKKAIQELFQVNVVTIRTYNQPLKKRRVGNIIGKRSQYKRAIVQLAPGNSINLFPEN
jgi:large subunit ribosomal protein L23